MDDVSIQNIHQQDSHQGGKHRNKRRLRRYLNINSTKDMWHAIQNTRCSKSMRPCRLQNVIFFMFDFPEDLPLSVSSADIRGIFQTINVSSLKTLWHSDALVLEVVMCWKYFLINDSLPPCNHVQWLHLVYI